MTVETLIGRLQHFVEKGYSKSEVVIWNDDIEACSPVNSFIFTIPGQAIELLADIAEEDEETD